jgi:hypothetical protein
VAAGALRLTGLPTRCVRASGACVVAGAGTAYGGGVSSRRRPGRACAAEAPSLGRWLCATGAGHACVLESVGCLATCVGACTVRAAAAVRGVGLAVVGRRGSLLPGGEVRACGVCTACAVEHSGAGLMSVLHAHSHIAR